MTPQQKRRAAVQRAAMARNLRHYRRIKKTIPKDWPDDVQQLCRAYIQKVITLGLGKKYLGDGKKKAGLVAWPWLSRPESPRANPAVKVLRGRPR